MPLNGKLERSMYRILGHGLSDFEVGLASKGIKIWHSLWHNNFGLVDGKNKAEDLISIFMSEWLVLYINCLVGLILISRSRHNNFNIFYCSQYA